MRISPQNNISMPETNEEIVAKLEEIDRLLPRTITDWVIERERDGLEAPEILTRRLRQKEELRSRLGARPLCGEG